MTQNNENELRNYTAHAPGGITVSVSNTRQSIEIMNNKSRYYAELAKQYKDEAKAFRDGAKTYAEENSDVTMLYINELEARLQRGIDSKQASGDYALNSALPTKVSDLTNDSGYLTNADVATTSITGVVQPDGTTITVNENGLISANRADKDLQNLTSFGNSRLQYAPFSINTGALSNGENASLYLPSGSQTEQWVGWTSPVLTSNSSYGTISSNINTGTEYQLFNDGNNTSLIYTQDVTLEWDFPSAVKFNKAILTLYQSSAYNASKYNTFYAESAGNWVEIGSYTASGSWTGVKSYEINLTEIETTKIRVVLTYASSSHGRAIRGIQFIGQEKETVSSTSSILNSACVITTCDGRTFSDDAIRTFDVSNEADGSYYIFKNISTGALSLISDFIISKTAPVSPSDGDYWLDISTIPAKLKYYDTSDWVINNNFVYIGDITVSSAAISSLSNRKFNDSGYIINRYSKSVIVETYVNGTSWYKLYSDGWCVQGGYSDDTGADTVINYIKYPYAQTPNVQCTKYYSGDISNMSARYIKSVGTSSFTFHSINATYGGTYWLACGYLN